MFITITVIQAIMLFLAISLNILSIWCKRTSGQWLLMKIERCDVMWWVAVQFVNGPIIYVAEFLVKYHIYATQITETLTKLIYLVVYAYWIGHIISLHWTAGVKLEAFFLFCYRIITNLPNNTQMHTLTKNKKIYAETRYE